MRLDLKTLPSGRLLLLIAFTLCVAAACGDDSEGSSSMTSGDPDAGVTEDTGSTDTGETTGEDAGSDTSTDTGEVAPVEPREAGARAPMTAPCDEMDSSRCLLPWPSDRFVRTDPTTETGLRVAIDPGSVVEGDDESSLNRANGHSRNSPLVTAFPGEFDPETTGDRLTGAIRLVVSEGDAVGEVVPMRFFATYELGTPGETVLLGYPRVPLRPNTEYAVAVMNTFLDVNGAPAPRERPTAIALGLEAPQDDSEAELYAYHAPSRAAFAAAGLEPDAIVRMWSYTTRSKTDPLSDLQSVREQALAALDAGEVTFRLDEIEATSSESVAVAVRGTVTLPDFLSDDSVLYRDADGRPEARGTEEAPFRVVIPQGEGSYKVLMYGHGFGGDVRDQAFDAVITSENAAKVNIQFDDWTEDGALLLADRLLYSVDGVDQIAAGLVRSIGIGVTVQYALGGPLGDLLSSDELLGEPNPAAGRRPDTSDTIWVGGSLGGTVGLVYSSLEPTVDAAVLNVPGAGFTHYLRFSALYSILELILRVNYKTEPDRAVAIAMGQINLDRIDGAAWFDAVADQPMCLIQESVGDPVLPNIGTDYLSASVGALHLGEVLHPIEGLSEADEAVGVSAVTQYKVPQDQGELAIHGFGDQDAPAGRAAQEQIRAFINSVWAGDPRIIVPPLCVENTPAGSCDFSDVQED